LIRRIEEAGDSTGVAKRMVETMRQAIAVTIERETLDREIYTLGRIVKDDAAALSSEKTRIADCRLLNLQIAIRKARIADLMQRRGALR
jgi:hypothetical protein